MVLPQDFRDSPHFLSQALQRDLQTLDLDSTTLLQHVDDLFLCSSSHHNCLVHTAIVLNALGNWGYRVSLCKAQIASTTVNYMGLLLIPKSKIITAQRLQALTQTPRPQTKKQTSFSIRSIKLLPNMGPKFCPPCKTSLPSYSWKLR